MMQIATMAFYLNVARYFVSVVSVMPFWTSRQQMSGSSERLKDVPQICRHKCLGPKYFGRTMRTCFDFQILMYIHIVNIYCEYIFRVYEIACF